MAKFRVTDVEVYGLRESMLASGFPMQVDIDYNDREPMTIEDFQELMRRCDKLACCKPGTGHDCFLKGIVVQMNITAPIYWWAQWDRYHFQDTVSSQSTMHKILEMDITEQCNEWVDPRCIAVTKELICEYKELKAKEVAPEILKDHFQKIIASAPRGLCLTRRVTTNYLQLKSMDIQRRGHKLIEWSQLFQQLLPRLPYSHWISGKKVE